MNDAQVIALAQDALMTTMLVAAPILIVSLVIGCLLLAPSIVLGYAVKAAERVSLMPSTS